MVTKVDAEIISTPAVQSGQRVKPPEVGGDSTEQAPAAPAAVAPPAYGFQLRVDQQTREVTAVIVDPTTRAVIREIPPEEMRIAAEVIRNLIGPLVDKLA